MENNEWSKQLNNMVVTLGAYWLAAMALVLYPSIVMIEQFGSLDGGMMEGFIAGLLTTAIILILCAFFRETGKPGYLILLIFIYLFFLWPFLQYLGWMFGDAFYTDDGVFPAFDWIPWLF